MDLSLFALVEQGMGCLTAIVGLSVLFRTQNWIQVLKEVISWKQKTFTAFALLCSFMYIPFGLAVILIHNDWSWSSSVIVTLLGWAVFLKSLVFLFFPEKAALMKRLAGQSEKFLNRFLKAMGVLYIALGFWILCPYWL